MAQYTNVYLCAKFGDLKPTIDEKRVLKFGPVSEQGAQTRFRKETAIFFRPNVSKMFIDHHDQQIVRQKNSKPRVMLRDQRGDQPSKI